MKAIKDDVESGAHGKWLVESVQEDLWCDE
jgi:hypothetical protein